MLLYNCNTNISGNIIKDYDEGARGVMVIIVGNEHGDRSSNSGRDLLHFT